MAFSIWHTLDLLIGMDAAFFHRTTNPGDTPHLKAWRSQLPTITSDLSGFGQWVKSHYDTRHGVAVVHRSDYNQAQISEEIGNILAICQLLSWKRKCQETSTGDIQTSFVERVYSILLSGLRYCANQINKRIKHWIEAQYQFLHTIEIFIITFNYTPLPILRIFSLILRIYML